MLTSEFIPEMGALLRRLEGRVQNEPSLRTEDVRTVQDHVERAIVVLVAEWVELERQRLAS